MSAKITSFRDSYRFLSNFWIAPVTLEGITFRSAEHAYQWAKMDTDAGRTAVLSAELPGNAKHMAKSYPARSDWNAIKLFVMHEVLRAKFSDPYLADWLLGTAPAELVEGNTWNDTFWGICNGRGENHLGRLLMEVRDELRAAAAKRSDERYRLLVQQHQQGTNDGNPDQAQCA